MRIALICLLFFSFKSFSNNIKEIGLYITKNETENNTNFSYETRVYPSLSDHPLYNFLKNVKDLPIQSLLKKSGKDIYDELLSKGIDDELLSKGIDDELDLASELIQEECMSYTPTPLIIEKNCDTVLTKLDEVLEHRDSLLEEEIVPEGYIRPSGERMLGIDLSGANATDKLARKTDPNYEVWLDSETSPNRNHPLSKGNVPNEELANISFFNIIPCVQNTYIQTGLDKDVFNNLITRLEKEYRNFERTEKEKTEIFCFLQPYYEQKEMFDKLIEFLFAYAPEGDLFCQ